LKAMRYAKRIYHAMRSKYLWLGVLMSLPILALAEKAPPAEWGGALDLSQNTAIVGFGTPISSYFWWLGMIFEVVAILTVIGSIDNILSIKKADKEKHGVAGKLITVLVSLAISVGLGMLLF
jgi:hypothetical protein